MIKKPKTTLKMKYFIISILIILVIVLDYTYQKKDNESIKNTQNLYNSTVECQVDQDCNTPMEFLIQSNCPFSSACIQGYCQVVCPLPNPDPSAEANESWSMSCQKNTDCDCRDRGEKSKDCICHNGNCLSIETN